MSGAYTPCLVCQLPIVAENDSREHVLPNAVGGRLRVKGLICRRCNNKAGEKWDAALAEQMQPLCHLFSIVRQRGDLAPLPIVTTAGEELTMLPSGDFALTHPKLTVEQVAEHTNIEMRARDWAEARRLLKGVKKKFPSLDIETELAKAEASVNYPEGLINHSLSFGGAEAGRSMVKTAAAFAWHLGVPTTACDTAAQFLRNELTSPPFGFYCTLDPIRNRPAGVPIHCVAVEGNPSTGLLLGYVEYFGAVRVVVCLSDVYDGSQVYGCYAIDPTTGNRVHLEVALHIDREELAAINRSERLVPERMQAAMAAVVGPAVLRNQERGRQKAVKDAVAYALAHCGAKRGDALTQEQVKRLCGLLAERLAPFLQRQMASRAVRQDAP